MFPYRLRPPVYGKNNGHLKRNAGGSVLSGGGPIQVAMEQDLTTLQTQYVDILLNSDSQEDRPAQSDQHAGSGIAFRLFKKLFSESKVALFHLLLPKNLCDKEAFSQLIYAACLEVFRRSFPGQTGTQINGSSIEHTAFALFALYALYETNPLPRKPRTPLELLPMGLQEEENFRALYRRAFQQNIRIDQNHYFLLLQLRELSMARIAACGHFSYKTDSEKTSSTWTCNCSVAKNMLEVMDRLSTKWELCEYTGPVGLEGLAGHADCNKHSTQQLQSSLDSSEAPPEHLEDSELSSDLKTSFQRYQWSLNRIRIPQESFGTATRLRNVLVSFFAGIHKESWSRVESRLYGTIDNGSEDEAQSAIDSLRHSEKASSGMRDEKTSSASVNDGKDSLPPFKTVLPARLDENTKMHLQRALGYLFQRERPALTTAQKSNDSKLAADDVSSIGIGGISIATDHGRSAIQTLLSQANANQLIPTSIRTSPSPKSNNQNTTGNNLADLFLNTDQMFGDAKLDEDNSESDFSNLSLSDYDEDDADGTSAATSAAGKQAIAQLLNHEVKKNTSPKLSGIEKKARKRKATQASVASGGSSMGQGEAALGRLLEGIDDRVVPKPKRRKHEMSSTASCGSSVGQGQDALDLLLATANRAAQGKNQLRTKADSAAKRRGNRISRRKPNNRGIDEEGSLAKSIGQGQALGALLNQVGVNTQESPNNDSASLASSIGLGQDALDALLAVAGKGTNESNPLQQKSDTA
eukprot:scaffold25436_cov127-Cylindrotheca_fusiformis.AAC.5